MELLDSSMDKIADKVYGLKKRIPEEILGKMSVCVSFVVVAVSVSLVTPPPPPSFSYFIDLFIWGGALPCASHAQNVITEVMKE